MSTMPWMVPVCVGEAHVTGPTIDTMWVSQGWFLDLEPDMDPEITLDLGQQQWISATTGLELQRCGNRYVLLWTVASRWPIS